MQKNTNLVLSMKMRKTNPLRNGIFKFESFVHSPNEQLDLKYKQVSSENSVFAKVIYDYDELKRPFYKNMKEIKQESDENYDLVITISVKS